MGKVLLPVPNLGSIVGSASGRLLQLHRQNILKPASLPTMTVLGSEIIKALSNRASISATGSR